MSAFDGPAPGGGFEDDRLHLAAAAASAERSNRPRWIVALGCIVLLVACGYAALGLARRSAAQVELDVAAEEARTLAAAVASLQATLAERRTDDSADRNAPDPRIVSKLTQFAAEIGIPTANLALNEGDENLNAPGLARKTYTARATNLEAANALRWLARAQEIKGLEISQLQLTPGQGTPEGQPRWTMSIVFRRWERRQ